MRVATHAYTDSMVSQFGNLAAKQYAYQSQASTGLRVQSASDDPAAMRNTLDYVADKARQTQYGTNISTLQARANSIYNVIQSIQTISSRAGEIATAAGSATINSSDLSGYAEEVNSLIQQTVTAANTKDATTGQYLFSGTASTAIPYTVTKDASGNITGVTHNGNSSVNQVEIGAGTTASVDVPGENTGASGARGLITDAQSGADLINHLISLRDHLASGDKTGITSTDALNLQKDENNVAYQVAHNGVVQNSLSAAATFATNSEQSLNKLALDQSSANLVDVLVQLNSAQTAYQAALQSGSKILSLSILNYIS
jgi:flagellar hook-associated protein 3 FlgL